MSQAQLAAGPDRLPWLDDDVAPASGSPGRRVPVVPAVGALAIIAAAALWIGMHSRTDPAADVPPSTTVALPRAQEPVPAIQPSQAESRLELTPEVRPAPLPEVRIAPPAAPRPNAARLLRDEPVARAKPSAPARVQAPGPAVAQQAPRPTTRSAPLTPWNPRTSAGAYGRLVQVGAFGSRLQAKRGWRSMVRSYPAMAHLPATVVAARNSRGRAFYRFQVGTTSQAHSEVLCQRMEKIRFSCAVIGLPWKAKVER